MKKFCRLVCIIMIVATCFTGCGVKGQKGTPTVTPEVTTSQEAKIQETPQFTTDEPQETDIRQSGEGTEVTEISTQFREGINQFSYKIFEQLENGKNIFISPYSMAIAVSMLNNGADGKSKEEIEKMLGIEDLEDWNACVKYYMSLNQEEQAKVLTANSIWLSDKLIFSENAENDFFHPVKKYYQAEKNQTDLTSQESVVRINDWVSQKTNQMINSILTEPLGERVKMLLLNAVYFKGEWKEKFDKEDTVEEKFYGKDKTSKTDMMYQYSERYKYIEKNGIRAIELPYANDKIAMDILLPMDKERTSKKQKTDEKEKSINECFSNLSEKEKSALFRELSKQQKQEFTKVAIPKFDMEYGTIDISPALKKLGMEHAFAGGDFGKISPDLYVGSVAHKAKVEVDEEGTRAAAVTSIMANDTACVLDEVKTFIVNEPFIFVIRDVENDMILFMGSMQNCE